MKVTSEYSKERARIIRATRRFKKSGLEAEIDFPTLKEIKNRGQDVSEYLERAKNLRDKELKNITYYSPETGEEFTYKEATDLVNRPVDFSIAQTVLEWVESIPDVRTFYRGKHFVKTIDFRPYKNQMTFLIADAIKENETNFENYLRRHQEEVQHSIEVIQYDSDSSVVQYQIINVTNVIARGRDIKDLAIGVSLASDYM